MRKVFIGTASLLLAGCAAKRVETVEKAPADVQVAAPAQAEVTAVKDEGQVPPEFAGATLFFEFGNSALQPASTLALQSLADVMRANQTLRVNIAGHCDERGTTEFNLALGHQRAEAAKRYLVALGVDEARVTTISYGEEAPAQQGQTEEAWAANRRDVIAPLR